MFLLFKKLRWIEYLNFDTSDTEKFPLPICWEKDIKDKDLKKEKKYWIVYAILEDNTDINGILNNDFVEDYNFNKDLLKRWHDGDNIKYRLNQRNLKTIYR